jgi:hypothetical protein
VPETATGNHRGAAGIEVFLAGGIGDEHAAAADGDRRGAAMVAVQDVGHGRLSCAGGTARQSGKHTVAATRMGSADREVLNLDAGQPGRPDTG